jgi:hypothetical protein
MTARPEASVNAAPQLRPILTKAKALNIAWGHFTKSAHKDLNWPNQKGWGPIKLQIEALAQLDLKAHEALKAKATDQDLKCIMKGLYLDAPKRIEALKTARDKESKLKAAADLSLWIEDHIVILSAPKTAESGLDCLIEFGPDKP